MKLFRLYMTMYCFRPSKIWLAVFLFLAGTSLQAIGSSRKLPSIAKQTVDEEGLANLELRYYPTSHKLRLFAWSPIHSQSQKKWGFPINVAHGIGLFVDGEYWDSRRLTENHVPPQTSLNFNYKTSQYETKAISVFNENAEIELRLYGHIIGRYKIVESKLVSTIAPRQISRFHLRHFATPATKPIQISPNLDQDLAGVVTYGPQGINDLQKWIENPVFIDNSSLLSSKVDLHTHLTGAIRTIELLRIAEKNAIPYPTKNLDEVGVKYDASKVFEVDGQPHILFSRRNIEFERYVEADDYFWPTWKTLFGYLEITPDKTVPFSHMDLIYRMRGPIVKNVKAFEDILESLAKDYARNGVKYAEPSFNTILQPEFIEVADRILPRLEEKYGVQLRFLVGFYRGSKTEDLDLVLQKTVAAMRKTPYIAGIDFMGEEKNSTLDFAETIRKAAALRTEFPQMVVRVHAGENQKHAENILEAIKAGATRIGHGIYGVTDEVIQLAKKNDVIVEFNFNSNLALQNIERLQSLKIATQKYLEAGVRTTFGTDGHGLYMTTPKSEFAVAKELGFTDEQFKKINESDTKYIQWMNEDSRHKKHKFNTSICKKFYN